MYMKALYIHNVSSYVHDTLSIQNDEFNNSSQRTNKRDRDLLTLTEYSNGYATAPDSLIAKMRDDCIVDLLAYDLNKSRVSIQNDVDKKDTSQGLLKNIDTSNQDQDADFAKVPGSDFYKSEIDRVFDKNNEYKRGVDLFEAQFDN